MDEAVTLESWDNACYICTLPFQTGDHHCFIKLDTQTYIVHQKCRENLILVIKEMRHESQLKQ